MRIPRFLFAIAELDQLGAPAHHFAIPGGVVAEHIAHAVTESHTDFVDMFVRSSTSQTGVTSIFHQCDLGTRWTQDVVVSSTPRPSLLRGARLPPAHEDGHAIADG